MNPEYWNSKNQGWNGISGSVFRPANRSMLSRIILFLRIPGFLVFETVEIGLHLPKDNTITQLSYSSLLFEIIVYIIISIIISYSILVFTITFINIQITSSLSILFISISCLYYYLFISNKIINNHDSKNECRLFQIL